MVIDYINNSEIYIQFDYGDIRKISATSLRRGSFVSKYTKTLLGRGYEGVGDYKCSEIVNGKLRATEQYNHWSHMLKRVYSPKCLAKMPTYKECEVCDEWMNYQNFAKWYDEHKWFEGQQFVDKDILHKGNKIYAPENCCLVNNEINLLFLKSQAVRGDLPIGVIWQTNNHNYVARCSVYGKGMKHIGVFDNPIDAFYVYKEFKEAHIKSVADKYKNDYPNFPQEIYEAMYNYEVEITD